MQVERENQPMRQKYCTICGATLYDEADYCVKCGAARKKHFTLGPVYDSSKPARTAGRTETASGPARAAERAETASGSARTMKRTETASGLARTPERTEAASGTGGLKIHMGSSGKAGETERTRGEGPNTEAEGTGSMFRRPDDF